MVIDRGQETAMQLASRSELRQALLTKRLSLFQAMGGGERNVTAIFGMPLWFTIIVIFYNKLGVGLPLLVRCWPWVYNRL